MWNISLNLNKTMVTREQHSDLVMLLYDVVLLANAQPPNCHKVLSQPKKTGNIPIGDI